MFASLRNKFSNYRTCSLRFDIKGNIIIEGFASLHFDNHVICLWCFWTCLYYRGLCCSWRCLHYRGLSCIWTCLHYRGCTAPGGVCHRARAASGRVCTTEESAASGDVYTTGPWAASERVCTTEVCDAPEGVCHRGLSRIWMCLHYRVMCLNHRDHCILTVERVRFTSKIICLLSEVFTSFKK